MTNTLTQNSTYQPFYCAVLSWFSLGNPPIKDMPETKPWVQIVPDFIMIQTKIPRFKLLHHPDLWESLIPGPESKFSSSGSSLCHTKQTKCLLLETLFGQNSEDTQHELSPTPAGFGLKLNIPCCKCC